MRYLSTVCQILFLIPLIGHYLLPVLVSNLYVNWSLFTLLSVLLPLGYSKSLANYSKEMEIDNQFPLKLNIFLVLFCLSVGLKVFINQSLMYVNNITNDSLEPKYNAAQLFEKTYLDNAEEHNKLASQFIYKEYGVAVQYKLDSGEYMVFEPSPSDIESSKAHEEINLKFKELNKFNIEQSKLTMFFSAFQIVMFLLISQLNLYWLNYKANKSFKQDK